MSRVLFMPAGAVLLAIALGMPAQAQQQQRPPQETTKVDGTDNVYIFRNGNHQAMFVVTKDGVIATDPVAYGKPQGGQQYVDAIKKITDKPIKYVIYSHHHYDHIAGGKALKDTGAKFIAHKSATERLKQLKDPNTVIPDELVSNRGRTIKLGGTTLELKYVGLNHSDSTLVMRLPKEKIIFVVDLLPVGRMPGRGMIDFYPLEAEELDQENPGDGMGASDPRPSGCRWPARHQERRRAAARDPAGRLRRDEEARPGGQVLGPGRKGIQAAEIRNARRL